MVNTFGKSGALENAWKLSVPLPTYLALCLFHLAVPELYPFVITSNLVIPEFCSSKLIKPEEGVVGISKL